MQIKKDYNHISLACVEHFLPEKILKSSFFRHMGIINGGISMLQEDFYVRRMKGRRYHIIIFTLSGSGKFIMEDGTEIISKPLDVFFSHAQGQGHIHRPEQCPWNILWFNFEAESAWLVPPCEDWQVSRISGSEKLDNVFKCVNTMIYEDIVNEYEASQVQKLNAELFMIYMHREFNMAANPEDRRHRIKFNQLWAKIAESITDPWTLHDLCDYMCMSRAHLSRLCKKLYKIAPGTKVKELKMEHAKAMLQHFGIPVSQVAEHIGYADASVFSAAFKKHFGFPPKSVR